VGNLCNLLDVFKVAGNVLWTVGGGSINSIEFLLAM
jgi:hypothetical protein